MSANLATFSGRMAEAGVDPIRAIESGAGPIIAHTTRLGIDAAPWLDAVADFVVAMGDRDPWSPLHFCIVPLAELAAARTTDFVELVTATKRLLLALHTHEIDTVRTEQYGVRSLAASVGADTGAMLRGLRFAAELAGAGGDPGWLLQLALPVLWQRASPDALVFASLLESTNATARALVEAQVSVGYPFATGVAALATGDGGIHPEWPRWMESLLAVGRSSRSSQVQPYATFEYGVPAIATMSPPYVTRFLDAAVVLADRAVPTAPALTAVAQATCATPEEILSVIEPLALAGIDPYFVVAHALPSALQVRGDDPRRDATVEQLVALARDFAAHAIVLRKSFEDGLPRLAELSLLAPELWDRGLALASVLASAAIDPGMTLAHGLPRALAQRNPAPWLLDECFACAIELAELGIDPAPALMYALPPLYELAAHERDEFRSLRHAVQTLMSALHRYGVSISDVLFYDVPALESVGDTSHAFVDLLRRIQTLLTELGSRNIDVDVLLREGLPAAARATAGQASAFIALVDAATRLAIAGNAPFANAVLEFGGRLFDAQHATAFADIVGVLEQRQTTLAPAAVDSVTRAIAELTHRDVARFASALDAIEGARLHDDASRALPALARLSRGVEHLPLVLSAVTATHLAPSAQHAFCEYGLPALSVVVRDPVQAASAIQSLAEAANRYGGSAAHVLRLGADAAASAAEASLEAFVAALDAVDELARKLSTDNAATRTLLKELIALARVAARAGPESFATIVRSLDATLEAADFGAYDKASWVQTVRDVVERRSDSWPRLIGPLIKNGARQSAAVMPALAHICRAYVRTAGDLDTLRVIVTQLGVRAADLLEGLVVPALASRVIVDLEKSAASVLTFHRDVGINDTHVYSQYLAARADPLLSEETKRERIRRLAADVVTLTRAIRAGDGADHAHPLFGIALMRVFPPAMSRDRRDYQQLFSVMTDRPEDLESRPIGDLSSYHVSLSSESWALRPAASADLSPWQRLASAVAAIPSDEPTPTESLGWQLLAAWCDGHIGRQATRHELLVAALHRVHRRGVDLLVELENPRSLLQAREVLADRARDVAEEALLACNAADPTRYDRLVRGKLAKRVSMRPGLVRAIAGIVDAAKDNRLTADEALHRFSVQLADFDVDTAALFAEAERAADPTALREMLESLSPRDIAHEPGIEVAQLHADWLGQEVASMQRTLHGDGEVPGLLVRAPDAGTVSLTMQVTKRRVHAAVGFSEGVCTATDVELWRNPRFFQIIFWDPTECAAGGMHALIVTDDDGDYLTLPGINPSIRLLAETGGAVVLRACLAYARRLAVAWNLRGVWIPTALGIASNRHAIQNAIAERRFPTRAVRRHQFSYNPFTYHFSEVFEVERLCADSQP